MSASLAPKDCPRRRAPRLADLLRAMGQLLTVANGDLAEVVQAFRAKRRPDCAR